MADSVRFEPKGSATVGRVTVTVKGEPLEIEFEPGQLGAAMAAAAAGAIQNEIRGISEHAADGHQLFTRTGRLVNGITAQQIAEDVFEVVPPSGYLQDDRVVERLVELVPTLDRPEESLTLNATLEGEVDAAIKTR